MSTKPIVPTQGRWCTVGDRTRVRARDVRLLTEMRLAAKTRVQVRPVRVPTTTEQLERFGLQDRVWGAKAPTMAEGCRHVPGAPPCV